MIYRLRIRNFWIPLLAVFILSSGCEDLSQDLEQVTMKVPLTGIVFQPADYLDKGDDNGYYQKEIHFDLDSLMQANDANSLEESFVDNLELGVLQPQNQDLAFLKTVTVLIDTTEDFAEPDEIGRIENVSPNQKEASFDLNDVNLSSYLRNEHFYVRIHYTRSNYAEYDDNTSLFLNGMLRVHME
ncbi:MAG: hypothetical protein ACQESX_03115 [Bacteroidota bacterium]